MGDRCAGRRAGGLVRSRIEPLAEVSFGDLGVRAGSSLSGSSDELRVDLGPDARLELRFEEQGRVAAARLRGDGAGADRAGAAAVLASAPAWAGA